MPIFSKIRWFLTELWQKTVKILKMSILYKILLYLKVILTLLDQKWTDLVKFGINLPLSTIAQLFYFIIFLPYLVIKIHFSQFLTKPSGKYFLNSLFSSRPMYRIILWWSLHLSREKVLNTFETAVKVQMLKKGKIFRYRIS